MIRLEAKRSEHANVSNAVSQEASLQLFFCTLCDEPLYTRCFCNNTENLHEGCFLETEQRNYSYLSAVDTMSLNDVKIDYYGPDGVWRASVAPVHAGTCGLAQKGAR